MKFYQAFLCFGLFSVVGCSSDTSDCESGQIEYPNEQVEIDGLAYKNSLLDCRLPKLQSFEFDSFSRAELIAEQGTILIINANSFSGIDGTPVDGTISLSILEMYNPGEIIACQLSTNGLNDTNTVEPLLSESIFFISATYNGRQVRLDGEIQIFIPSENRDLELAVFNSPSCNELECEVLWEKLPQSYVFYEPYSGAAGDISGYRSYILDLGWFSIARYNDSLEERGILYNKALSPYSLSNSKVFLKYDSNSTAIGMFSEYDDANGVFSEKYREIPNNIPGNVIFVSKPESYFNFQGSQVITDDGKITVTRQLQSGSESDLIDYINNL